MFALFMSCPAPRLFDLPAHPLPPPVHRPPNLATRRLSASTAPIVPPFAPSSSAPEEMVGPSSITSAELALAFSGIPEDDMSSAAVAHAAAAAAAAMGIPVGGIPGFPAPLPALPGIGMEQQQQQHLGRPLAGGESGPAKKRRRGQDGGVALPPSTSPAVSAAANAAATVGADAYASAAASAAAAAAAASAAASVQFGDPAAYHAAYSQELLAAMAAAGVAPGIAAATAGGLLLPPMGELPPAPPAALSAAEAAVSAGLVPMVSTAPAPMETVPMAVAPAPVGAVDSSTTPEVLAMAGPMVHQPVGSKCAVEDCAAPVSRGKKN